jgi:lipopolysaccharide heptosyltransferase II
MRDKKIKNILIMKLCCVGDVLFTTPAVRALRQGFPKAHLAYMVGSWSKGVIEDNPHLDQIITYDAPAHSSQHLPAYIRTLSCLLELRHRKFDLAVIFHRASFAGLFARLAGIPRRIGFDYGGRGRHLTRRVTFDSGKHEVDRYLDVVTALGCEPAGAQTEIRVTKENEKSARELLKAHGVKPEDRIVGVLAGGGKNPGTSMPIKRWAADRFARLIDDMTGERLARVILIGGPGDEEVSQEVLRRTTSKPVSLVGKTTFKQLAAVLKRCNLFVGGDSGPLHMAAAVGTSTVGIFGPSDPRLVAPRGKRHLAVWKHVPCSPCYQPDTVTIGQDFSNCHKGSLECMDEISLDDVLAAVDRQWERIRS